MKVVSAILIFVVSLSLMAGSAMAVDPQTVELEKRRLQQTLNNIHFNPQKSQKVQDALNELERNPELYFYKKQGRQKSAGASGSNIGQCMNDCSNEQGICNGSCQGNTSCMGRCSAAWSRCTSRCR